MGETCRTHGIDKNWTQNFSRKIGRKRPIKRPGRKWQDNIKTDFR